MKTRISKFITINNNIRQELFQCSDCKARVKENQLVFDVFSHFLTGDLIEDGRCKNCDDAFLGG